MQVLAIMCATKTCSFRNMILVYRCFAGARLSDRRFNDIMRFLWLRAFVGFYLRIFLEEFGYQLIFLLDRVDATALDRHRIHLKFHLRCHRHFPIQCFLRDGSPSEWQHLPLLQLDQLVLLHLRRCLQLTPNLLLFLPNRFLKTHHIVFSSNDVWDLRYVWLILRRPLNIKVRWFEI